MRLAEILEGLRQERRGLQGGFGSWRRRAQDAEQDRIDALGAELR